MKLKEFEEKIKDIALILIKEPEGVCGAIDKSLHRGNQLHKKILSYRQREMLGLPRIIFNMLLRPNNDILIYYFGSRTKENVPIRLTALYLFKEHCISLELYKEF